MNTEDLQEQLRDNQEVLTSHSERIGQLEKREAGMAITNKLPDYSNEFAEMRLRLEELAKAATPSKQADEFNIIVNRVLAKMSGQTKTIVEYRIAGVAKGALVGTIIGYLLLITTTTFAVQFWRENGRLQQKADKLALLRHTAPSVADWADSAYLHRNDTTKIISFQKVIENTDYGRTALKGGRAETFKRHQHRRRNAM